ncbi:uncharacterized protein V1513DRAFT_450444 [Lipomyces chichibuensis]|uniref:uncharacterized protein n=1 Tax=Lipomyces chichibuensis TaxID=1546026 RepID=UPI0033438058
MTSSDMARHLAPLISASPSLFTPVNHPSSPAMTATIIPLEQHYSFDENLQTRTFHHPPISSSPARELSWLPMMPDIEPPTSPASVSESLIDPLCSVLQPPQSPTVDQLAQGDEHYLNALYFPESGTFIGYRGFPTFRQTTQLVNAYISTLSSVKKNKSLISRQMYADIKTILRDAGNTAVGSAQFRFWARRNFELFRDTEGHVCVMHKGKPVAVREELYDVLAVCHLVCRHGGRDKTLGQLREWHSRVPKNLISQFIKLCPTCNPTSVTAESHPEYLIDTHTSSSVPRALDEGKPQVPVSFTLRKSIVCCKMSPGIDAVVRAAESAAATADKGRDETCYVVSEDDRDCGAASLVLRKSSLLKSVTPVAFIDREPAVKLKREENPQYSFPAPPERVFLGSVGTESTVSLHSSDSHGEDTAITLAMAQKALANFSAFTHPSAEDVALPSEDVFYDQTSSPPCSPAPRPHRILLAELEPNLVSQHEPPSSPLCPESDEDEYEARKRDASSYSPPRRAGKRRATAAAGVSSCASPVRKSARLHKTLLF